MPAPCVDVPDSVRYADAAREFMTGVPKWRVVAIDSPTCTRRGDIQQVSVQAIAPTDVSTKGITYRLDMYLEFTVGDPTILNAEELRSEFSTYADYIAVFEQNPATALFISTTAYRTAQHRGSTITFNQDFAEDILIYDIQQQQVTSFKISAPGLVQQYDLFIDLPSDDARLSEFLATHEMTGVEGSRSMFTVMGKGENPTHNEQISYNANEQYVTGYYMNSRGSTDAFPEIALGQAAVATQAESHQCSLGDERVPSYVYASKFEREGPWRLEVGVMCAGPIDGSFGSNQVSVNVYPDGRVEMDESSWRSVEWLRERNAPLWSKMPLIITITSIVLVLIGGVFLWRKRRLNV